MAEHREERSVEAGDTTRRVALVSVNSESAEQVALTTAREPVRFEVRGSREAVVELAGGVFLPRNCRLDVSFAPGGPSLTATVRKVKMTGAEPTYSLWAHLESDDAPELGAGPSTQDAGRDRRGSGPEGGALRTVSAPGWARRLVADGALTSAQLEQAVADAKAGRVGLDEALLQTGLVLKEAIAISMALDQSVPFVDPRAFRISPANRHLIPEELARRHVLFPLFSIGGLITLGMKDPGDLAVIDHVRLRAKCQVEPCVCPGSLLESLIERIYRSGDTLADHAPVSIAKSVAASEAEAAAPTIVRLVRSIVAESARDGASDIHIEPEHDQLRVRIRIDGILHEKSVHPLDQHAPVVSRIKVESKLDIAETRKPQDGQYSMQLDEGKVDIRVSTVPTVCGENVVMRLLKSDARTIGLEELGVPDGALAKLEANLANPNGMILVTGPTGSGKTTTLYACLARLATIERNVVTVEDPVEKRMPLLRQTQVNVKAGLTFASGLRSFLRQDPDVIMVGEIRDQETAEIAIQAALTGHLVLSTLHTNSASDAIVRLREMGIPPFLITSSLRSIIAQRLARRTCAGCIQTVRPDPKLVAGLGMETADQVEFKAGAGCVRCMHTGYKGRIGIYEMLEISARLGDALVGGASREVIEREAAAATEGGLLADGLRRVREGATTLEEIVRVVGVPRAASSSSGKER